MECELCKTKNEKFRIVFDSKFSYCMICKRPLKFGHLLVLPKRHCSDISELTPEEAQDILTLVAKARDLLKSKTAEDIIIHINSGAHSSQRHPHIHVLPSKGNLRTHVSHHENISRGTIESDEFMEAMKESLLK